MSTNQAVAPLTIIAIFAGIIESSALAILPFLNETSQSLYTWFLVGFPFFLTALFFLTLNFNYKSLYKPEGEALKDSTALLPSQAEALLMAANTTGGSAREAEPLTIMLSGPEAQIIIKQHILRILTQTPMTWGTWTFCNLDKKQCYRLSISELPQNTAELMQ